MSREVQASSRRADPYPERGSELWLLFCVDAHLGPAADELTLSFGQVNYAEFLPGIQRTATRHRMRMPNEFILITKQLLYFDRYAKSLAPKLNVFTDPRLVLGMMSDIQKARMQADAASCRQLCETSPA